MGIQTFPTPEIGGGGGYNFEVIQSINLATGSPASVTFSAIDPKYRALQLVVHGTGTNVYLTLQLNGDTGSNYKSTVRNLTNSSWATQSSATTTYIVLNPSSEAQKYGAYIIENTNIAAFASARGAGGGNGNGTFELLQGIWLNSATVSSVTLGNLTGTFAGDTAYLLGSE